MIQRLREWLTIVLLAALPFHALAVTVLTKIISGPGHAPISSFALWKEILLGVILCISFIELLRFLFPPPGASRHPPPMGEGWGGGMRLDLIDALIIALLLWSFLQPFIFNLQFSIFNFALGFKYDFIPLVAFLVLRRVPWSKTFQEQASRVLLTVGGIVATYGILTFFLPQNFFTALGYSDLHSLYVPDGPLAPYQQIGGTMLRRIQSTMSGPNQLGIWLLIPLSVIPSYSYGKGLGRRRWGVGILLSSALLMTFSRAAWIAAAVILFVALWRANQKKLLGGVAIAVVVAAIIGFFVAPELILRTASSRDHWERPMEAVRTMIAHPLGLGLGSAGPASNRVSDACVYLEEGADASWAAAHPSLCVFTGAIQVQPSDKACNCPLLPENWYLQIGVELGWIGMALYLAFVVLMLKKLLEGADQLSAISYQLFLGISIAALFLHAWEDSAVAYTAWVIAGLGSTIRVQKLKN